MVDDNVDDADIENEILQQLEEEETDAKWWKHQFMWLLGGPVYLQQIKLILTGYTCTFITYVKALKYSAYGYIIFYGNHFRRG